MATPRRFTKSLIAYVVALHVVTLLLAGYAVVLRSAQTATGERYQRLLPDQRLLNVMFDGAPPGWLSDSVTHTLVHDDQFIAELSEINGNPSTLRVRPPWSEHEWVFYFPSNQTRPAANTRAAHVIVKHTDSITREVTLPGTTPPDQPWTALLYIDTDSDGLPDQRRAIRTQADPNTRPHEWNHDNNAWTPDPSNDTNPQTQPAKGR